MKTVHTFLTLATAVLLTACANPNAPGAGPMSAANADQHAAHRAGMRDKMMNAKTPAERQALMDEHMKTMQMQPAGK